MSALVIAMGVTAHFALLVGLATVKNADNSTEQNIGMVLCGIALFGAAYFWASIGGAP